MYTLIQDLTISKLSIKLILAINDLDVVVRKSINQLLVLEVQAYELANHK